MIAVEFNVDTAARVVPASNALRRLSTTLLSLMVSLADAEPSVIDNQSNAPFRLPLRWIRTIDGLDHTTDSICAAVEGEVVYEYFWADRRAWFRTRSGELDREIGSVTLTNWLALDGTGKLLAWLLDKGIKPQIPVWERYERPDGMFSRRYFTYDAERDIYLCPNGRPLRTSGAIHDGRVRNYLSQPADCRTCELKTQCTRAPFRKIARDINEKARDHARSLNGTPKYEQSRNERKKVEMRFAHLKTHHRFERMRLRGLSGARDEFHLAAIVQNLKTLAIRIWRPPPNTPAACVA